MTQARTNFDDFVKAMLAVFQVGFLPVLFVFFLTNVDRITNSGIMVKFHTMKNLI